MGHPLSRLLRAPAGTILDVGLHRLTPETQPGFAFWGQKFLQKIKFLPRLLSLGLNEPPGASPSWRLERLDEHRALLSFWQPRSLCHAVDAKML